MSQTFETINKHFLPTIPLRNIVVFPHIPVSIELNVGSDIDTALYASSQELNLFLCPLVNICDEPTIEDFCKVGTIARLKQCVNLPDGNVRIVIDGISRASIATVSTKENVVMAEIYEKEVFTASSSKIKALRREVQNEVESLSKLLPEPSSDIFGTLPSISQPDQYCDFIAANILINQKDKQQVLCEYDICDRFELLCVILKKETTILKDEAKIHAKVKARMDANQRDFYIREQIKALREELGDDDDAELTIYADKIRSLKLDADSEKHLLKEVDKLSKSPYTSSESAVIRAYLDTCLEIPFGKYSVDELCLDRAKTVLDRDHYGMDKIKEKVLEYLSVRILNPQSKGQILCFAGAPGTGKTSICASIAESMGREYVRVCLGGIRDEADIRGHRKTYVGSMPGRIVDALIHAKTMNPVVVLDEIDKIAKDGHGDPSSALLEVLDSAQNNKFRDHFVEIPIDLSDCLFIATANEKSNIPTPLYDRMDIVDFDIYNANQKLQIAKNHLIKKQRENSGLKASQIKFTDAGIKTIIDEYTREAGVRNLNRLIGTICAKVAKMILEGQVKSISITKNQVYNLLGNERIENEPLSTYNEIGVVNGLAYTSVGGSMLKVEALSMDGEGKLELTGSLGDVMKESAKAAYSYIRGHYADLNVPCDFYKNKDIHLHFPEGAIPKDGPSAGVTIITAMVSELSGVPVKRDIAMTGEISLRGKVLPIGGLKEKTMAAYQNGIKAVLIPKGNEKDIESLDSMVKENLKIIPCEKVSEVINYSLVR